MLGRIPTSPTSRSRRLNETVTRGGAGGDLGRGDPPRTVEALRARSLTRSRPISDPIHRRGVDAPDRDRSPSWAARLGLIAADLIRRDRRASARRSPSVVPRRRDAAARPPTMRRSRPEPGVDVRSERPSEPRVAGEQDGGEAEVPSPADPGDDGDRPGGGGRERGDPAAEEARHEARPTVGPDLGSVAAQRSGREQTRASPHEPRPPTRREGRHQRDEQEPQVDRDPLRPVPQEPVVAHAIVAAMVDRGDVHAPDRGAAPRQSRDHLLLPRVATARPVVGGHASDRPGAEAARGVSHRRAALHPDRDVRDGATDQIATRLVGMQRPSAADHQRLGIRRGAKRRDQGEVVLQIGVHGQGDGAPPGDEELESQSHRAGLPPVLGAPHEVERQTLGREVRQDRRRRSVAASSTTRTEDPPPPPRGPRSMSARCRRRGRAPRPIRSGRWWSRVPASWCSGRPAGLVRVRFGGTRVGYHTGMTRHLPILPPSRSRRRPSSWTTRSPPCPPTTRRRSPGSSWGRARSVGEDGGREGWMVRRRRGGDGLRSRATRPSGSPGTSSPRSAAPATTRSSPRVPKEGTGGWVDLPTDIVRYYVPTDEADSKAPSTSPRATAT